MNAKTLLFLAFSVLIANQQTLAQSCAAEAQTRRDTCDHLVKPIPHSSTPSSASTTTASQSPASASNGLSSTTTNFATSEGVSSSASNAPSATTTTVATSEGVCTCSCESSVSPSTAASAATAASEASESSTTAAGVTSAASGATSEVSGATSTASGATSEVSGATSAASGATGAASGATASGELVDCLLVEYFYNISVLLSGEEYDLFIEWIQEIQVTILADISLSYDEQVVQIGFSLKAFFSEHVEIQEVLYYEQLGSWGFVVDFIYVAYQIQIEITQEIVTLDSSGDCALFDALRNATADNSEQAVVVEELIFNITIILQESAWTYSQQQAQIYLLFQEFFVQYSQWESFFLNIQIEGYGILEYYYEVAFWYQEIVTIDVVIGGDVSDCVLLQSLTEASQNTSFSVTVRNEFEQLEEKLSAYFANNSDVDDRLNYVVTECYSFFELVSYMEIYVDEVSCGSWGFIYDIIFCSDICVNYGCGNPDNGPGTLPPSSDSSSQTTEAVTTEAVTSEAATTEAVTSEAATTEAVTTEASTTAAVSTQAATTQSSSVATSTVKPADCSNRWAQLEIQVSSNTTYFTSAVGEAYATWSSSNKASFNTYWNQIRNAIWNTTSTHAQILQQVVTSCSEFNKNNAAKQQILYNVTIVEWVGTVKEFVACGTAL